MMIIQYYLHAIGCSCYMIVETACLNLALDYIVKVDCYDTTESHPWGRLKANKHL